MARSTSSHSSPLTIFMDLASNGIVSEELVLDWTFYVVVALSAVILVLGLYLLRPSRRPQIVALWDERWKRAEGLQ